MSCILNARGVSKYVILSDAQYTPPTQLNCRVESRRRCVRNSQLA